MKTKNYWFIFYNNTLLLEVSGDTPCISLSVAPPIEIQKEDIYFIGIYNKKKCYALDLKTTPILTSKYKMVDLRASSALIKENLFFWAGRASQILMWARESRFCPVCGTKTLPLAQNSKICPACKKELYPVISTAIMVLIKKGKSILMVRGINFKSNSYGLVAGFLEPGETLEECVAREVMEETNLKIKNVKYASSQPWPFPSGLMVGFTADYMGGKLKIDKRELVDAGFFTVHNMPPKPPKISLARKLIDAWLKTQKK